MVALSGVEPGRRERSQRKNEHERLTSAFSCQSQATKSEELLSSQLEQMNDRFNVRMSNRQDHVVQLDALKEEVSLDGRDACSI